VPIDWDAHRSIGGACELFAREHKAALANNTGMQRCFLMHLINLSDFHILTPDQFNDALAIVQPTSA
jgi:hypothetical protein